MTQILAAESGFHVPPLEELFEFPAFLFEDSNLLAFNRTALLMLLSAIVISLALVVAFNRPKLVPSKFQGAMESVVQFVREQIVLEVMGPAGLRYVPLLTAIFLFVWFNNLYEILPFVQFPTTGRMAIPAFLAIVVWTLFILVGLKHQGIAYFKNVMIPSGVPKAILILVIPIELVSTFIVRPLTLAVRLFANMMAGHILLAIIFIAANAFLIDVHAWPFTIAPEGPAGLFVGVVALAFGPAMVAFELMVGALQAYIFTILTAVYVGGSLHPEH